MAGNYDITRDRVQALFPQYDHEAMADRFGLRLTDTHLYITMLKREFRMDRKTGYTDYSDDDFATSAQAGFNEVLTIMDVLCDSKPGCALSGKYCTINEMDGVVAGTRLGKDFWYRDSEYFDQHIDAFRSACEKLGGLPLEQGDASYQLDLFSFLPFQIRLWQSDDEFPVSMQLMFDRNLLSYMKYETSYYAMGYAMERIRGLMGAE